jgi:capsular polysaccharide biosynthesis protein
MQSRPWSVTLLLLGLREALWDRSGSYLRNLRLNDDRDASLSGARPEPNAYAEAFENEYTPSVRELIRVLFKRLWMIVLVTGLLPGLVVGFDLVRTPVYEASIKILVGQEEGSSAPDTNLGSEAQGLKEMTQTMAEGVASSPVAEAVIRQQGLQTTSDDFLKNLKAEQVRATQFIDVSYEDTDPQRAQRVANAVGQAFSDQVATVSPSANRVTATVWEPAQVPIERESPKPVRDGLVGLAVGALFGVALALLLEYMDDGWRSPEEVERISGLPSLGVIPDVKFEMRKKGSNGLVTLEDQRPPNPG